MVGIWKEVNAETQRLGECGEGGLNKVYRFERYSG
jgi:hypothetical protein